MCLESDRFVDACELAMECGPSDDDISVLTFIGGYVARSASKKKRTVLFVLPDYFLIKIYS